MVVIETGDYVTLHKSTATVRSQVMGWRIDTAGDIAEIFLDGFYTGFDIGEDHWLIQEDEDNSIG